MILLKPLMILGAVNHCEPDSLTNRQAPVQENGEDSVRKEEFVHKQNPRGTQKVGKAREVVADLPEGWRAFRNSEGLVYYYHMQSGTTRWSLPGEHEPEKETPKPIEGKEGTKEEGKRRNRWS